VSSAFVWALLPILIGVLLLFYRLDDRLPLQTAIVVSLFLTWVAWQIPIDIVLQLGPLSVEIAPTLNLLGRNFSLGETERPLLAFIYLMLSFWQLGALVAKPSRLFASISLITVGLFVAALSVEPFLYAALILAAAVLVSIPLLVDRGSAAGRGVQRFLKFQLLAVPCILFTGWLLTGVESSPGNTDLVLRAGFLLALGFGFLLGLFPFHAWLPMLSKEANPYTFGFMVFFVPAVSMIFALGFFDQYVWLRENAEVYRLLMLVGSLNVCLAGLWAAAQRDASRIFAFAALASAGGLLQAAGLGGALGVQTFFSLLLPQAWAFWMLAASLAILWNRQHSLTMADLSNWGRLHPLATGGVVVALMALAGLPLLGPFAAHLAIWRALGERSVAMLAFSLLGSLGLAFAGLRILLAALTPARGPAAPLPKDALGKEIESGDLKSPYVWALFGVWMLGQLGFGLLPRFFLGSVPGLAAMFSQLFP
jgi:formate hydrogenlyase subunit 3/multisubunit Na+/H+ antiporter MnhD subunit